MIEKTDRFLKKTVRYMGEISGWILCACMLLVTFNVLLRAIFGKPILGTYEWVGFLTAISLSLGLPYCASVGGHIAVDFIVAKFKPALRWILSIFFGVISAVLMVSIAISLFLHAGKLLSSGEVSPTTQIPFYVFVCITGIGFVFLSLVILIGVGADLVGRKTNES
jgi:TRAP-type C4-dicarboxylate transport system permease small subunit